VSPIRSRLVELPGTDVTAANGLAIGIDPSTYGDVDRTEVEGATREQALAGVARGGILVAPDDEAGIERSATVTVNRCRWTRWTGSTDRRTTRRSRCARSRDDVPVLERELQRILDRTYPNVELLSTADIRQQIDDQLTQQFGLSNAILGIAPIVSILGVINTLAMSVIERTREIGVLLALGSSRWLVRSSLLNESLLLTLAGEVVGVLSGLIIGAIWIAGLGDVMPGITFRLPSGATSPSRPSRSSSAPWRRSCPPGGRPGST
jgi:hypothetical protein